jgi:hypothetical protein
MGRPLWAAQTATCDREDTPSYHHQVVEVDLAADSPSRRSAAS